jgi:hypothetical protein
VPIAEMLLLVAVNDKGHVPVGGDAFVDVGLTGALLAELMVRAGVVRGMQMDINPFWPVFVTYDPPAGAPAGRGNGSKLLPSTVQGPWTFFEARWARDFVTMSARPAR